MEFTIGQNSSLPILKLQVVKDGIEDYNFMMEFIERSSIFFTMVSVENGIQKVYKKSAGFVEKLEVFSNASAEYYVFPKPNFLWLQNLMKKLLNFMQRLLLKTQNY